MIRFLVQRPIAVLISFFSLMLLGITAFLYIPASLLPSVDIPQINVKFAGVNYSTKQVEENLTSPIRNGLLQLHGLERIESTSSEDNGIVHLTFVHGINNSLRFIEVNEKIDAIMNQLPKNVERPLVVKASVSDMPVFNLNIYPKGDGTSSMHLAELSNFAREIIRRRIEQLPEVSMVDISGFVQPEIQLIPKEGYLQSIGIDNNTLLSAFQQNGVDLGNIMVKDGHYQYFLRISSELQTVSTIENIPLNIQGRLFKLNDLVDVIYTNAPERGAFYFNGHRSINFAVIKQSEAKMSDLKKSFGELMQHMIADYPDIDFAISQNQTRLLDYSITNLQQDLALGGLLAFLLMLVFIRKLRSALLIGITIPLSLILSQLGFYLMDISINIVSLGGLILGLGMIIDNSIVVIDNINRYVDAGFEISEAAIQGTNEIVRPLITSLLTNCAVFVPLIFMSGLAGAIFYDQALSITIGALSSLVVSVLLLPPLYKLAHSSKKTKKRQLEFTALVNISGWYEWLLKKVFKHQTLTFLFVSCLLISASFIFSHIRKERLPPISRFDTELHLDWNENISTAENANRISLLLHSVGNKIIENNSWIGQQQYLLSQSNDLSYTQCKIYIRVADANELSEVQKELNRFCSKNYPQALLSFTSANNAFDKIFSNELAPIRLDVGDVKQGGMPPEFPTKQLIDSLQHFLPKIKIDPIALYEKITLTIDVKKAALYQINNSAITKQIELALKPVFVDNFQEGQILVPIMLTNRAVESLTDILTQTFIHQNNLVIPLSSLITVSKFNEYKYITAGNQGKYYPINIYTNQPEIDLPIIKSVAKKFETQLDVSYEGAYFDSIELIKQMSTILAISVLLLYLILAAQFESFVQPLFILIELPIALSGVSIFLYLGNNSINLMSLIGIIVMGGLIINDSILKIDAINQLRKQGKPLMEAIYEGGHKRLKPIVMISLTSIGALLPTLFMNDLGSELQKPLALALIGGMFVGMFVSLFFVPLLYWLAYRKNNK